MQAANSSISSSRRRRRKSGGESSLPAVRHLQARFDLPEQIADVSRVLTEVEMAHARPGPDEHARFRRGPPFEVDLDVIPESKDAGGPDRHEPPRSRRPLPSELVQCV